MAACTDLRDRLLEAYAAPQRGYHNVLHLSEVLDRIDVLLRAEPVRLDRDTLLLAAWFHDAVYDPERSDNEQRSAALAAGELTAAGAPDLSVSEVVRLVRLTATHAPADDDVLGQVLCDADLGVLAADPARYADYTAGVREEYAHLSGEDFHTGRDKVLRDLLSRRPLFHRPHAQRTWEEAARRNMTRELAGELPQG
jgi:predicted metal-dependent HD superfamily phosphohydrolase